MTTPAPTTPVPPRPLELLALGGILAGYLYVLLVLSGLVREPWFRLVAPNLWLISLTVAWAVHREELGGLLAPGRHGGVLQVAACGLALVVLLPRLWPGSAPASTGPEAIRDWLLLTLLVPVAEELYFRGLLQARLTALLSPAAGAVVVAFLFTLLHHPQGLSVQIAVLALITGAVTAWSGTVVWAVLVHVAWNGAAGLNVPALERHATLLGGLLAGAVALTGWWLGRRSRPAGGPP